MRAVGDDDDLGCPGHVWAIDELHLTLDHAGVAQTCRRCGAVRYDDAQDARREPLA